MGTAEIVCVGTAALDTIALVDRLPRHDERIEALRVVTAGGGNAATSAVTIARLGLAVEFSGVVGDDAIGDAVITGLQAEGVGTSLVERRPGVSTAASVILVDPATASRAIVAQTAPSPGPVPSGFAWVHLDKAGYQGFAQHPISQANVSLDDGNLIPGLDLSGIRFYVPTAAVLRERFGVHDVLAAAQQARTRGASTVVATNGGHGSVLVDGSGAIFAPALPIEPVSTLGAGDVFHGAFLAAIVLGRDPEDALRFANVTAALSCRALDGRAGIPDRAEVDDVLTSLPTGSRDPSRIAALLDGTDI